jgi:hypothetical protein
VEQNSLGLFKEDHDSHMAVDIPSSMMMNMVMRMAMIIMMMMKNI